MRSNKLQLVIVTPAKASANNGNWRTAERWRRFLAPLYPTRIVNAWPDGDAARDSVMIALHARRSAASIAAWRQRHDHPSLAVVLSGTDLYRDIQTDAAAQHSLAIADRLVTLQELGPLAVPPEYRAKTRVIFHSAAPRKVLPKTASRLRALMVGHLREEKSPTTLFAAARMIKSDEGILIDHIGSSLDEALAREAQATMAAFPHYRWLGNRPHEETRRRIQRAHVLVHCSRIEGGAHAVIEAAVSGTPVLASRIDGNLGLLGENYRGYFRWGDSMALVELLRDCHAMQARTTGRLQMLAAQVAERTPLFAPAAERAAVRQLVSGLLSPAGQHYPGS